MKTLTKFKGFTSTVNILNKNDIALKMVVNSEIDFTDVSYVVVNPFTKIPEERTQSFSSLGAAVLCYDELVNNNNIQFGLDHLEKLIAY
jgi:hypothetical protein